MLSYGEVQTIVKNWTLGLRVTQMRNVALLVFGLLQCRSGCLSAIVRRWPVGSRRHVHRLKRLHRFLKNKRVSVWQVSEVMAEYIWAYRPGGKKTKLVPIALDWTKVRQFHVLWAALPRKRRALPIAHGVYHPNRLRHSQNKLEEGLCALVASWLPAEYTPLLLADAGFGRTEFVRWLKRHGFAYVVRLRPDTLVSYRGRVTPLSAYDTIEGAPIILSHVSYRAKKPVVTNIVISRLGDSVWYLGTSLADPRQAVAWYKKRFWIEEMFRDMKSRLGLRQAQLKGEKRLARLLMGYQLAYFILTVIASHLDKRWQRRLSSRARLSVVWLALEALPLLTSARHKRFWCNRIWPSLLPESG